MNRLKISILSLSYSIESLTLASLTARLNNNKNQDGIQNGSHKNINTVYIHSNMLRLVWGQTIGQPGYFATAAVILYHLHFTYTCCVYITQISVKMLNKQCILLCHDSRRLLHPTYIIVR